MGAAGGLVGSWIGWKMGAPLGMVAACLVSTVGTAVGVYFAKRLSRAYFG